MSIERINPQPDLRFIDHIPKSEGEHLRSHGGDTIWAVNNSSIQDYGEKVVFPKYGNLMDVIAATLKEEDPAGLDLAGGSQGYAIRDLIEAKIIRKGLVTNLEDRRSDAMKEHPHISHLAGDLANQETWQSILQWQQEHAPEGLGIVLHRPAAAMQHMPSAAYTGGVHFMLDLVKPGGIYFSQIPQSLEKSSRKVWFPVHLSIRQRPDIQEIIYSQPSYTSPYAHVAVIKQRGDE